MPALCRESIGGYPALVGTDRNFVRHARNRIDEHHILIILYPDKNELAYNLLIMRKFIKSWFLTFRVLIKIINSGKFC